MFDAARSVPVRPEEQEGSWLVRGAVWVLLGVLVLRFAGIWLDASTGLSIPVPAGGSIGFTLVFTAFSVLHARCVLGGGGRLRFLPYAPS
jgi:hypothetical protein